MYDLGREEIELSGVSRNGLFSLLSLASTLVVYRTHDEK